MSFGGHVQDMNNRIKENEALKKSRRKRFNKLKEIYSKETGGFIAENNLTKQKLSKKELQIIKNMIRFKLEAERRKRISLTVFSVIILSISLFLLLKQYNL